MSRARQLQQTAASDRFRRLYAMARTNGYMGTRTEFCVLVLRTKGLAAGTAIDSAVAWLNESGADLTYVRRNDALLPADDK